MRDFVLMATVLLSLAPPTSKFSYLVCVYQVRLTDALVSSLNLKKSKDVEIAWLDARIVSRESMRAAKPALMGVNGDAEQEPEEEPESNGKGNLSPWDGWIGNHGLLFT